MRRPSGLCAGSRQQSTQLILVFILLYMDKQVGFVPRQLHFSYEMH